MYHQSTLSVKSAMDNKGKKRGRKKYKKLKDKGSFSGKINSIFDQFLKVLL